MPDGEDAGAELIRRGWVQGALVRVGPDQPLDVRVTLLIRGNETNHELMETLPGEQLYLVATQTCDLARDPSVEPVVELLPAGWTTDQHAIRNARRNSTRQFLLRTDGAERGLIADVVHKVWVAKDLLLGCAYEPGIPEGDTHTQSLFRRWLAQRYARIAVPDAYVLALQKPVVDAIQRLGVTHQVQRLLDGIDRILFVVQSDDDQPFKVELILMRNERLGERAVDELGVSELVGWMENVLRERGNATIVHWDLYDSGSISLRDYASAYPLALDHYTLLADAEAGDRDVFRPDTT